MVLILCGLSGFTQNNNTSSPFSRYGLGDLHHYGYGRTAAMGGASLGSRHAVQINSANPASYTANDSLSFIFEFGLDGTFSNYKSNFGNTKADDINFRYFSLSWPVTKWLGGAMGIQPFSDMGYEIGYLDSLGTAGNTYYNYFGEGTTSKAFLGTSVSPLNGLSIGVNLNYIFGSISKNTKLEFADPTVFSLSKTESTRFRDFTLSYGLQYDYKIKQNQYLTLGVTFEKKSDFTVLYKSLTYKGIVLGSQLYQDNLDTTYQIESKRTIKMPSTFGIGLSFNNINKLEINADYYHAAWSDATLLGETDQRITNMNRFSAGFEYIPEAFSIRSYFKRVKYRAGIHYENSYLNLKNQQINEIGISFGAGLPFPKSKSTANLAFEFGKKGTTNYDLVKNNYAKISVYLNFYDYWFMKRKFD